MATPRRILVDEDELNALKAVAEAAQAVFDQGAVPNSMLTDHLEALARVRAALAALSQGPSA